MTYRLSSRHGTTDPFSMTAMAPNLIQPTTELGAQIIRPTIPTHVSPPGRHHARSTPTTPSHALYARTTQNRSPSIGRTLNNSSPRSVHSDSSQTPPAARKIRGGCKYETAMARARRRVPYSLGPDKLGPDPAKIKKRLGPEEEARLSNDMQDLYRRLLPSEESEAHRARLVEKLESLLQKRWPTASVKVNVFGSTGNNLGTSDSDVDICVTTDCNELSRVCSIAELLANNGMERVVCVSSAKVPIVKVWDPELQVACDLNVNNPIALENTAMIRCYNEIDPRVRPLAMIIKHWAKRRILNDAALGGTLSSYTWICLTLNFLQTREPPIIPSLQQQTHLAALILNGVNVAFDKDIGKYKEFGIANRSTLGELLYQFFRFYAFDFDFEEKVVSVRLGSLLSKIDKGWHLLQDNRLCVEEPFNTSRNLANTADDTSMRGIHLELRRAFAMIADGHLDKCCEPYIYPPDEPKSSEHFVPPTTRPVITQSPYPARGGKLGGRGGRNAAHLNRNNVPGRRSSNPTSRTPTPMLLRNLPFQMTTQELQLQAQHQQHLLHDQLFQQFQYLQLQEQELRARLNQQRQRSMLSYAQYPAGHYPTQDDNADRSSSSRPSPSSRTPLSAPLYQHRFAQSPFLNPSYPVTGIATNPSSPHLSPAMPDNRRFSRRTSLTQASVGASLRAHSQPARMLPTSLAYAHLQAGLEANDYLAGRRSSASSSSHEVTTGYPHTATNGAGSVYEPVRRPAEYVGYYVGQSPSLLGYPESASISPIPSHIGLAISNGGLSPRLATASPLSLNGSTSLIGPSEVHKDIAESQKLGEPTEEPENGTEVVFNSPKKGPLIVDGSASSPRRRQLVESSRTDNEDQMTFSTSTSEDLAFDTPSSSDEHFQDPTEIEQAANCSNPTSDQAASTSLKSVNGYIERTDQQPARLNGGGAILGDHAVLEQTVKPTFLPWSLGRQLSVVQEVRTPSPGLDRGTGAPASPTLIVKQQFQTKEKKNDSKRSSLDIGASSPRPNGGQSTHTEHDGASAATQSSWQTPKKRRNKKKTVKSENDGQQGINDSGGEFLPLDQSQRKGG